MTDKEKIREKVERLKSQLLRGACSSQIAMETRCKEEAYNEVLGILDTMQEEPKKCMYSTANYTNADRLTLCKDCKELCRYNQKTAAESLGISQEAYDEIVDKCLYASEVELVDDVDLPKEEPVSEYLEKEIQQYIQQKKLSDVGFIVPSIARHFAEWKMQQMMRRATDGQIEIGEDYLRIKCLCMSCPPQYDGKLVKLIIIKED